MGCHFLALQVLTAKDRNSAGYAHIGDYLPDEQQYSEAVLDQSPPEVPESDIPF